MSNTILNEIVVVVVFFCGVDLVVPSIQESLLGLLWFPYNKTHIDFFFCFGRFSGDLRFICRTKSLKI